MAFDDTVDEGVSQNALQIGREGRKGGILHFGIGVLNWFEAPTTFATGLMEAGGGEEERF